MPTSADLRGHGALLLKRPWVLLAAAILIAFVAAVWQLRPRQNFKAFVAREVKAGVPAGTTRSAAEAWCVRTFRLIPSYRSPREIAEWKTWLGKKAGVPAAVPGGVIEGTATPREPISRAYDLIRPQHVWYYLLLDEHGKVYDYRLMSFNDLREIERWR